MRRFWEAARGLPLSVRRPHQAGWMEPEGASQVLGLYQRTDGTPAQGMLLRVPQERERKKKESWKRKSQKEKLKCMTVRILLLKTFLKKKKGFCWEEGRSIEEAHGKCKWVIKKLFGKNVIEIPSSPLEKSAFRAAHLSDKNSVFNLVNKSQSFCPRRSERKNVKQ